MNKLLLSLFIFGSIFGDVTPYISREVGADSAINRARADSLRDYWRGAVLSTGLCDNMTQFSLSAADITQPNASTLQTSTISGLNVTISNRDMSVPVTSAPLNGTLGGAITISTSNTMQDTAPRPESLYNTSGQPGSFAEITGSGTSRNGVLIEFNQPVYAFGAWFGDLETNSTGTNALVRFFDNLGNQIGTDTIIPADLNFLANKAVPITESGCGAGISGCGNQTTRFISFIADQATPVSSMVVIVGDDSTAATGNGQHTSLIGPTAYNDTSCRSADMQVIKTSPQVYFEQDKQYDYEIFLINKGPNTASNVVLTDTLPAGLNFISAVSSDATLCNYTAPNLVCNYASVETDETIKVTLKVQANTTGTLQNNIQVAADEIDPISSNNSMTVDTIVSAVTPPVVCPTPVPPIVCPTPTPTATPTPPVVCPTPGPSSTPTIPEPVFCGFTELKDTLISIDSGFNAFVRHANGIASLSQRGIKRKQCSASDVTQLVGEINNLYSTAWHSVWSMPQQNYVSTCAASGCVDINQATQKAILNVYINNSIAKLNELVGLNCLTKTQQKQLKVQTATLRTRLLANLSNYPATIRSCVN